jgi:two-component system phosphate regulon sensor histidine kinase PhoR
MDQPGKRSRPLLLFYLLVAYVFVQFIWWSYHLFQLNNEVHDLRAELILLKAHDSNEIMLAEQQLTSHLHKRWSMIIGEGLFFLVLLVLAHIKIRQTFRKETALANQQHNFLLSITHELKTPLASTRLQLETLLKRDLDRDKQKEILGNAISDTDRLNKLVENILLAARIDDSSYHLHRESEDISVLTEKLIAGNLRWLQQKHKIVTHIEPGITWPVDRMGFESIVLNLLENAVKYSPAGTEVSLGLARRGNKIVLAVKDEGPGIADDEKEEVFKKFFRSGNEETRQAKGTGLGLYIVKYLVSKHEGTITVKNNSPAGSIFEICFG